MSDRLRGILVIFLCFLLLLPTPAHAQSAATATLSIPNADAFPLIEAYLDVHDTQGRFVHGLQADQIRVLEDEKPVPISEIKELLPGLQVVIAINPGSSLGVRNSQGVSRYDFVKENLIEWAKSRQGSTLDDLSLVITNKTGISHVNDSAAWQKALEAEQIDARSAVPNLDTLFRAVNLAGDNPPRPGMGRAVLLITPPLDETPASSNQNATQAPTNQSLDNLSAQAKQRGVSIFVWMVSSPGAFRTTGAERLTALAEQTGGKIFTYTGEDPLPDPEEYLEPLRHIYRLSYQSGVASSGAHQLKVQIQGGVTQVETDVQTFEVTIQPPVPIFNELTPKTIELQPVEQDDQAGNIRKSAYKFIPAEQTIGIIVDYIDGYQRPLTQSALYVDGVLVAENLAPPFDQFTWDLTSYQEDDTHTLQVQIIDILGLVGTSVEETVIISVKSLQSNPWLPLQHNLPIIIGLAVLMSGAILLLVLVLGGRLRPGTLKTARRPGFKSDPVTQPIPVQEEAPLHHLSSWVNRLQRSPRSPAPKAYAFLSHISDNDNLATDTPMPITGEETTLGSDPKQATLVISDPSVEALHARLTRQPDGSFRLADEASIAGTWINYTPVSSEGIKIEHGDLVHIGRVGFRFTLRHPAQVRKPVVVSALPPEEPPQEPAS